MYSLHQLVVICKMIETPRMRSSRIVDCCDAVKFPKGWMQNGKCISAGRTGRNRTTTTTACIASNRFGSCKLQKNSLPLFVDFYSDLSPELVIPICWDRFRGCPLHLYPLLSWPHCCIVTKLPRSTQFIFLCFFTCRLRWTSCIVLRDFRL